MVFLWHLFCKVLLQFCTFNLVYTKSMKRTFYTLALILSASFASAQNNASENIFRTMTQIEYNILRDSCTALDVVFTKGNAGTMSVEGKSVSLFSSFVDVKTISAKSPNSKDGFIMWQRNGREFLTGDIYLLSDSTSYLRFKKDDREMYHLLTSQGAAFLRSQMK